MKQRPPIRSLPARSARHPSKGFPSKSTQGHIPSTQQANTQQRFPCFLHVQPTIFDGIDDRTIKHQLCVPTGAALARRADHAQDIQAIGHLLFPRGLRPRESSWGSHAPPNSLVEPLGDLEHGDHMGPTSCQKVPPSKEKKHIHLLNSSRYAE